MVQNPFADLSCAPQTNEDRIEFIPRTTIDRVIAACPNLEREVIFALARYGGARVPSRSFRRYAPVSNGLTTSASPGRSTRCREQWGGPSSALDAQQFAGPPPALPETDRRRLRASHRLPGAKPDTFSGHLEPSTLHYAREKSLDVVKDAEKSTPDRDRTCDLSFRKAPLYPTELRGRMRHAPAIAATPAPGILRTAAAPDDARGSRAIPRRK